MSDINIFVAQLNYSYGYLTRNLETITHDESLIQPPFTGNCINWVLGHILVFRHFMLRYIEQPDLFTKEEIALYNINSAPITSAASPHLHFDRLLTDLEQSQKTLLTVLPALATDYMSALINPEKPTRGTKHEAFVTNCIHESMHVGQVEQLREVVLARR